MTTSDLLSLAKRLVELGKDMHERGWRASDYTHEPKGTEGVRSDEMETFIINPGTIPTEYARFIAAARSSDHLAAAYLALHEQHQRLRAVTGSFLTHILKHHSQNIGTNEVLPVLEAMKGTTP